MIDLSRYKIHDLTQTVSKKTTGFSASTANTVEQDGWNAQWLRIYSHAGTHMDAPFHFGVNDKTIDYYEPAALMGKAWIARVEISQNQQLIGVEDMGSVASKLSAGDSLLIQTGWSQKIDHPNYRNDLPRISKELARWCVDQKVKILGVEPPSVADVNNLSEVTEVHRILLRGDVIIVEGLRNIASIKKESVFLIALPLKISKGDGAPARVIAFESK